MMPRTFPKHRRLALNEAFERRSGYGLAWLDAAEVGQPLPQHLPSGVTSRPAISAQVICRRRTLNWATTRLLSDMAAPAEAELASLILTAPMIAGAEHLTQDVHLAFWDEMAGATAASLATAKTGLQMFLADTNPAWHVVGKVHFNLAENRRDPERPFAFMVGER
jgi:hypothetical protein